MTANSTKELNHYYIVLHKYKDRLFCPHCNESVLAKHFENHVFQQHEINGKTVCVWCEKISWLKGEKYKHKKHLLSCFREFVRSNGESSTSSNINVDSRPHRLLDMTHPFPEKDFFGHEITHPDPLFDITIEEFLNIPASPLPIEKLPPLPITFEDENLNFAASCVLLYLSNTFDFFHVMIKLVVFEGFLEAMHRDNSYTLPFSCWCDGGTYPEPEYRQHRHVIVVSPKNHFRRNVWLKIKLPSGTRPPNFPCKKLKPITSPLYLVNVIGYLSQRKSRCNFSFNESNISEQNNHFYLYRTLPVDFKLHLALLWDGGVSQLLYQTKFQNVSVACLAQGILTHDGRRWTQKIKDFYGHEQGLIVRVARDYVPTQQITPHFLHLAEGRKLYFEKLPEKLEPELWLRKQIEGGNSFYDAVEEGTWIPRKRDQQVLNFHRPVVERNRELESRLGESNREIHSLKSKVEEMQLQIQHFRDQIDRFRIEEIDRLKRENNKQKHKIARLKLENNRLKHKITRLNRLITLE